MTGLVEWHSGKDRLRIIVECGKIVMCIRVYNVSYDFRLGDNVINNLQRFYRLSYEGMALSI